MEYRQPRNHTEEKMKIEHRATVEKRTWDYDDDYCVVPEFQVDLPEGTKVKMILEWEEK